MRYLSHRELVKLKMLDKKPFCISKISKIDGEANLQIPICMLFIFFTWSYLLFLYIIFIYIYVTIIIYNTILYYFSL